MNMTKEEKMTEKEKKKEIKRGKSLA